MVHSVLDLDPALQHYTEYGKFIGINLQHGGSDLILIEPEPYATTQQCFRTGALLHQSNESPLRIVVVMVETRVRLRENYADLLDYLLYPSIV